MGLAHFVSKVFWFVVQPGNLLLLVLLVGTLVAWLRPGRSGRIWLTALSALLLFATFAPIYSWIARPLEDRFPSPASLPAQIDGILVLGGVLQRPIADERQVLAFSESAERIMVPAALALLSSANASSMRASSSTLTANVMARRPSPSASCWRSASSSSRSRSSSSRRTTR